ncbi:hypothetical protein CA54_16940 [Symmachiella macrocystis]|uniref:Ice-binding protein C-terminal domain-containing protein n=2 Tax=Symmachiella macrocystis TaxID=2527985 RepID=A0A5C6BLE2_9PLAN|nr:hypothetical protein CA54_16940 [Symmachiella macrocystis]
MKRISQIAVGGEFVSAACGRFAVFSLMFLFTSVANGEFAVSPTTLDGNAFLQSFDADGNTTFAGHAFNNFNAGIDDLAFDSNGDLYLLLSNSGEHPNSGIYRFDPNTSTTTLVANRTTILGQGDLAVSPTGGFAVSPTTLDSSAFLQSFDADGNTTFAGHAFNNFNAGIDDLAFDSNGDLYLLLSNSGEHPNSGIYRFDPNTSTTTLVANRTTILGQGDLAVSPTGGFAPVPEPSTYAGLLGITCVSLLAYGWRRKRQQAA